MKFGSFQGGRQLLQEITLGAVHLLPPSVGLDPVAPGNIRSWKLEAASFG